MILAFETSTDVCSVAFQNKEGQVFEERVTGKGVHSTHLFLFVQKLTGKYNFQIDEIETALISNGPGSYTGLRIGASAIKGLFFGKKINLFAVNTLAAVAASQLDSTENTVIHAILDARRSHLYHQEFKINNGLKSSSEPALVKISKFEEMLQNNDKIAGTGLDRVNFGDLLLDTNDIESISAINIIKLFNLQPTSAYFEKTTIEELNPNYITSNQINNTPTQS